MQSTSRGWSTYYPGQQMNFNPTSVDPLQLPSLPFSERKRLPSCAAVYFVLSKSGEVLYIGQAVNLVQRWKGHHRVGNFNTNNEPKISWIEVKEGAVLDGLESRLIERFCPPLNGIAPFPKFSVMAYGSTCNRLTPTALRRRVGLTQVELAQKLGKSLSAVSQWEQFAKNPRFSFSEVKKCLQVYQCSLDELIEAFDRIDPDEI